MNQISRREALKRLSLLVGGTLSASTVSAVLGGCGLGGARDTYVFKTLTPDQQELVATMADVIIPATDTPGARDVGTDQFIDLMLSDWMDTPDKERFLHGLQTFASSYETKMGKPFGNASSTEQLAYLEPIDAAAMAAHRDDEQPLPFFATLKRIDCDRLLHVEIGGSQELRHQMIFQTYDGNVDLKPGDRAWS